MNVTAVDSKQARRRPRLSRACDPRVNRPTRRGRPRSGGGADRIPHRCKGDMACDRVGRCFGCGLLYGPGQNLGSVVRRGPVCVDDQVLIAVVDGLKRGSGTYVNDSADRDELPVRWLSEVHREAAGEHDESLVLLGVDVTAPSRARLIAPHVRTGALEPDQWLQFGDVPRRLTRFVRTGDPSQLFGQNDRELHARHIIGRWPANLTPKWWSRRGDRVVADAITGPVHRAEAMRSSELRVRQGSGRGPAARLYSPGMTSKIGQKGQVVIPKAIRDQVQLHPGDEVEVGLQDDRIVITARRQVDGLAGKFAHSGMAARLLEDRAREPR